MISAGSFHLVRLGILGHIGRFRAIDANRYERGTRVVCRTGRGLEVGEVLSHVTPSSATCEADGSLLRAMTVEDELLLTRLGKNRSKAYDACARLLEKHSVGAALIDVEQLFDGGSIYFYFLGTIPDDVQPLIDELGEAYEAQVRFRDFASAVEHGCGPACGTDEAAGCGSSCSSCSIAGACRTD